MKRVAALNVPKTSLLYALSQCYMAQRRKRNHISSDSSSDDADLGQLVQLSAAAEAAALPQDDWAHFIVSIDEIVQGVTDFCQSQGLLCKARVRSSDKSRATIACKQQPFGCPLRLTIKKATLCNRHGRANMHTFVMGTCSRVITPPASLATPPSDSNRPAATPRVDVVMPNAKCTVCDDDVDIAVISCGKGEHHFCSDCLNTMTQSQIGDLDAFIQRRMQLLCPYDGSVLCGDRVADVLSSRRNRPQASTGPGIPDDAMSPHDRALATIRHIVLPRCPNCDVPIVDFEACAALTCGRRIQLGDRIDTTGGCGADVCAWCLVHVPPNESAHVHVKNCHKNPNPDGSLYPPQPHPQIWKSVMAEQARERVFNFVEMIKGSENRLALYSAVRLEFPELQMSEEWLAKRHQWLLIMLEMAEGMMDIHRAEICLRRLVHDMGFEDSDALRRAILLCNYDIRVICDAMHAHVEREKATRQQ